MKQKNNQGQYDILYPKTLGSQVEGTIPSSQITGTFPSSSITGQFPASQIDDIYTKGQTLTQATATLFGLGTNAVPDDVFAYLGKYAQHWWRRRKPNAEWAIAGTTIAGDDSNESPYAYILYLYSSSDVESATYNIQYSDELEVSGSGEITGLKSPVKTLSLSYDTYTNAQQLRGKYFMRRYEDQRFSNRSADRGLAYLPEDEVIKHSHPYSYEISIYPDSLMVNLTANGVPGDWEYLRSSNRNAYPDSGEQDGYEYEYLGVPFDNAVDVPKIETGSYVGTGTYGADNPNSLTFGFDPIFLFVGDNSNSWNSYIDGMKYGFYASSNYSNKFTKSATTVSWYNTSSDAYQLNSSGTTYYYIALG